MSPPAVIPPIGLPHPVPAGCLLSAGPADLPALLHGYLHGHLNLPPNRGKRFLCFTDPLKHVNNWVWGLAGFVSYHRYLHQLSANTKMSFLQ